MQVANRTVREAGLVLAPAGPGQVRVEVGEGGTFELVDSLVPALTGSEGAGQPAALVIQVQRGGTLRAANTTLWLTRILLEPGSLAILTDTELHLQHGGILARNATLLVLRSRLLGSSEEAIQATGGSVEVVQGRVEGSGAGRPGIAMDGGRLRIEASTIANTTGYGVQASHATVRLADSTITGSMDYGLLAQASNVTLTGSTLLTFCGAQLTQGSRGEVSGTRVASRDHGLTVTDSGPVAVLRNRFEGVAQALILTASNATVHGNTFSGNQLGALLQGSQARLERNRFLGNAAAVDVASGGPGVVLRNDTFEGGTSFALRNQGAGPVDAAYNWWGTPAGPRAAEDGQVRGRVGFAPWLPGPP
jgi:hypothetical protein